jgi:hypothetical protein
MPERAENSAPAAPRIIGRPFAKGTTGNAGGRSKVARDIQALAQEHGPAAIATLAKALKSRNERVRVAAAAILLEGDMAGRRRRSLARAASLLRFYILWQYERLARKLLRIRYSDRLPQ